METYLVEPDGRGGFQVLKLNADGSRKPLAWGCPSRQAAEVWIAEQSKIVPPKPARVI